jgi:hypothetical protein
MKEVSGTAGDKGCGSYTIAIKRVQARTGVRMTSTIPVDRNIQSFLWRGFLEI